LTPSNQQMGQIFPEKKVTSVVIYANASHE